MMRTVERLIEDVRREATRAEFPVDVPVYEQLGKDPAQPVLFAGSLDAPICIFGRDLGKDEVAAGQPMVGAAGRLVREGICRAFDLPISRSDRRLEAALEYALLTNTVPYKPPGNKAYAASVKERFRPFLAELLAAHWEGDRVISLGTEAFQWFAPYARSGQAAEFWAREDRYEVDFPCLIVARVEDREVRKAIRLSPLPHPSPLNQRWYKLFPSLLDARLAT